MRELGKQISTSLTASMSLPILPACLLPPQPHPVTQPCTGGEPESYSVARNVFRARVEPSKTLSEEPSKEPYTEPLKKSPLRPSQHVDMYCLRLARIVLMTQHYKTIPSFLLQRNQVRAEAKAAATFS
ncbi:hypothetical protein BGZ61DRAFT_467895 [Ilyonectria robusta]|uniref:uncharacterized protein n=1 Tax=Ilyonectria robusta TaxID=1079257 RepID=UPI001E8E3A3F|nr:uncharacterized protein BGZ61DRAFT_467895 [Ilyonectria robusta]KAH8654263.1 hypothetical protein BGZ61DRAFT_467895 [Ilyonectria robusta]